jgi:diacylglycerol kinase family enzyme
MRIALVVNPRSGRGRAARIAGEFEGALRDTGHEVSVDMLGPGAVGVASGGHEVAVAVGGDGTVQYLAGLVSSAAPPRPNSPTPALYHVPTGNENLFAREFGMTRSPGQLVAALARPDIRPLDLARLSGTREDGTAWSRPVLLMAGFSVDAGVIERLHATRRRASGHLMYVRPILAELLAPHFPRQTLHAGEREVLHEARGVLVIANCGRYARRLDPCRPAKMDDGLLDAAFMPCTNLLSGLAWAARAALGRLPRHSGFVHATAPEFALDFPEGAPCQIDGEALGFRVRGRVTARCEPGALRVLVP